MGYDWASVVDHVIPIQSDPLGPCVEGPTLLAAMAAQTSRLRRGLLAVGNTSGQGVYLRRTPRLDDRDRVYLDGTRLEQIGEDTTAEGATWRHMRAPDGRTGWVPARYTLESR
jgi:hypothetical protein